MTALMTKSPMYHLFRKTRTARSQPEPHQKPLSFWPYTLLLDSVGRRFHKGKASRFQNTDLPVPKCHQSTHELPNQASDPATMIERSQAPSSFYECFYSLPRELRDLVYDHALVSAKPIGRWKFCNNYSQLEEVRTLKSLLLTFNSRQVAKEACETFFAKNTFIVAPWRLVEFLGPQSRLIPEGGTLDVTACIDKIIVTIIDMDSPIPRPRSPASEFRVLLECPNLRKVIIDVHETDNFKFTGRDELCFTLCSIARTCKKLRNKLGDGLKLRLRRGHKLRRANPEECYSAEDVTWLMEEQDGLDEDRDSARATFAECALAYGFSSSKTDLTYPMMRGEHNHLMLRS